MFRARSVSSLQIPSSASLATNMPTSRLVIGHSRGPSVGAGQLGPVPPLQPPLVKAPDYFLCSDNMRCPYWTRCYCNVPSSTTSIGHHQQQGLKQANGQQQRVVVGQNAHGSLNGHGHGLYLHQQARPSGVGVTSSMCSGKNRRNARAVVDNNNNNAER